MVRARICVGIFYLFSVHSSHLDTGDEDQSGSCRILGAKHDVTDLLRNEIMEKANVVYGELCSTNRLHFRS